MSGNDEYLLRIGIDFSKAKASVAAFQKQLAALQAKAAPAVGAGAFTDNSGQATSLKTSRDIRAFRQNLERSLTEGLNTAITRGDMKSGNISKARNSIVRQLEGWRLIEQDFADFERKFGKPMSPAARRAVATQRFAESEKLSAERIRSDRVPKRYPGLVTAAERTKAADKAERDATKQAEADAARTNKKTRRTLQERRQLRKDGDETRGEQAESKVLDKRIGALVDLDVENLKKSTRVGLELVTATDKLTRARLEAAAETSRRPEGAQNEALRQRNAEADKARRNLRSLGRDDPGDLDSKTIAELTAMNADLRAQGAQRNRDTPVRRQITADNRSDRRSFAASPDGAANDLQNEITAQARQVRSRLQRLGRTVPVDLFTRTSAQLDSMNVGLQAEIAEIRRRNPGRRRVAFGRDAARTGERIDLELDRRDRPGSIDQSAQLLQLEAARVAATRVALANLNRSNALGEETNRLKTELRNLTAAETNAQRQAALLKPGGAAAVQDRNRLNLIEQVIRNADMAGQSLDPEQLQRLGTLDTQAVRAELERARTNVRETTQGIRLENEIGTPADLGNNDARRRQSLAGRIDQNLLTLGVEEAERRRYIAAMSKNTTALQKAAATTNIQANRQLQGELLDEDTSAGWFQRLLGRQRESRGGTPRAPGGEQRFGEMFQDRFIDTAMFGASGMALYGVLGALASGVTEAENFQFALAKIEAQYNELGDATFDQMRSAIVSIAKETGTLGSEVASVALQFRGAFGDTTSAVENTRAAIEIARVTGLELVEIIDSLTAATKSYDAVSRQTIDGTTLQEVSVRRLGDVALSVQSEFGVLAKETIKFLGDSSAVLSQQGVSIEEAAFIIGAAQRDSGRSGTALAEGLNRVFPALAQSSRETYELFRQLANVDVDRFGASFERVQRAMNAGQQGQVFIELAKVFPSLDKNTRDMVINLLGGRREAQNLIPILNSAQELSDRLRAGGPDDIFDETGNTAETFATLQETIRNTFARLREEFNQLVSVLLESGLGDAFVDALRSAEGLLSVLIQMTSLVSEFNSQLGGMPIRVLAIALAFNAIVKSIGAVRGFTGDIAKKGTAVKAVVDNALAATLATSSIPSVAAAGAAAGGSTRPRRQPLFSSAPPLFAPGPSSPVPVAAPARAGVAGLGRRALTGAGAGLGALGITPITAVAAAAVIGFSVYSGARNRANAEEAVLLEKFREHDRKQLERIAEDRNGFWQRLGVKVSESDVAKDAIAQLDSVELRDSAFGGGSQSTVIQDVEALISVLKFREDELVEAILESSRERQIALIEAYNEAFGTALMPEEPASVGFENPFGSISQEAAAFRSDLNVVAGAFDYEATAQALAELQSEDGTKAAEALEHLTNSLEFYNSLISLGGEVSQQNAALMSAVRQALGLSQAKTAADAAEQDGLALGARTEELLAQSKAAFERGDLSLDRYLEQRANAAAILLEQIQGGGGRNDPRQQDNVKVYDGMTAETDKILRQRAQTEIERSRTLSDALLGTDSERRFAEIGFQIRTLAEATEPDGLSRMGQEDKIIETIVAWQNQRIKDAKDFAEAQEIYNRGVSAADLGTEGYNILYNALLRSNAEWQALQQRSILTTIATTGLIAQAETLASRTGLSILAATRRILTAQLGRSSQVLGKMFVDGERLNEGTRASISDALRTLDNIESSLTNQIGNITLGDKPDPDKDKAEKDKIKAARRELEKARAQADPVELARLEVRWAQEDLNEARDKQDEAGKLSAQAAEIMAQRQLLEAQRDVRSAQLRYLIAIEDSKGNVLESASLAVRVAQAEAERAREMNLGVAAISDADAAVVAAQASYRDTKLEQELENLQFQRDMNRIGSAEFIAQLRTILLRNDLTEAQRRDLERQIRQAQSSSDLQFNLPSMIRQPTLYEARRLDQSGTNFAALAPNIVNTDQRSYDITLVVQSDAQMAAAIAEIEAAINAPVLNGTRPRLTGS